MEEMDGLILGQNLKDLYPNLIYLTDDRGDALDAMTLRAGGCMLLPVSGEAVSRELAPLRYPPDV